MRHASRAYAMSMTSVSLSVHHPSLTLVYCDHIVQDTAEFLIPHKRAITLLFWPDTNTSATFQRDHPNGVPNRGGVGSNRRFSTDISLYLTNGAK